MSHTYKLKLASLDEVLKRAFGLAAEDDLQLEVKGREAVIKVAETEVSQVAETPAPALLDFMDSLPEPAPGEEPTNYASQVDDILYRDRHFK